MYSTAQCNQRGFDSALYQSKDVSRRAELSLDQEGELAALIAGGDLPARNRMVLAHLGLVVAIARKFQGRGLLLDDLVGEGNLGLIRAAMEYDPRRGTRFSTFAFYLVKQSIEHALMTRTAMIRVPVRIQRLLIKWRRAERMLQHELKRMPGFEEVASNLGLSQIQESLVQKARQAVRLKLEDNLSEGAAERWLVEVTAPHGDGETTLEANDDRNTLFRLMESLDEREHAILVFHYGLVGEVLTLREIGRWMGISLHWVRKIEARAIRKLRIAIRNRR